MINISNFQLFCKLHRPALTTNVDLNELDEIQPSISNSGSIPLNSSRPLISNSSGIATANIITSPCICNNHSCQMKMLFNDLQSQVCLFVCF